MVKEQRSYTRFSVEGNVVLKPEDATLRTIRADLFDICYIGIGVCAPERIETGIHAKFEIRIKQIDDPLAGEGIIVYTYEIKQEDAKAFRMGIKFIDIDNKKILSFLNLIQRDIFKARNKR